MIGFIGISGKMGSYLAETLNRADIIGYDKVKSDKFKTCDNVLDFFSHDIDLVIDFSNSDLSKDILLEAVKRNIKVLSGTSNIPNIDEIAKYAYDNKVSFVYLENFTQGIKEIINMLNVVNINEIELIEEHNIKKKDNSQTALSISKKYNINNVSKIRTIKKESNHYIKIYYEGEQVEIIHKCENYAAYKTIFLREYNQIISRNFYYKYGIIN